jgi:regulator of sigma E protease
MFAFLPDIPVYLLSVLFVLGLVVTVHEFGHFLAARLCGVAIDRFSIGFGKALASWRDRSGVEWRIGWIPLGGYVKFAGDENAASVPDSEDLAALRSRILAAEGPAAVGRYFHFKPVWQRAIVTAAGPLANFVLSSVLFAVLLGAFGQSVTPPRISGVIPGGAGQAAGFQAGDLVREINGRSIRQFSQLMQIVALSPGKPLVMEVERAGKTVELTATPRLALPPGAAPGEPKIGMLGLAAVSGPRVHYTPVQAIGAGIAETGHTLSATVYVLGQMVTGHISASNISGVVGIAQASGQVAKAGAAGAPDLGWALFGSLVSLLGLAAVMSVSIGFMNLLPVPVLDGGHLLFYAYEALARRPLGARLQAAGYRVGLALLLSLMVFATWNDLQRLRVFQIIGGLFS